MRKPLWLVGATMLLLTSACNRNAEVATPETPQEPSPTTSPSFQLEGKVIEASGSAKAEQASPSPDATTTASPGVAEEEGQTEEEGTAIEQASPGSLALRLSSYSGQESACVFSEGDTVVVLYTRASTFEPDDLTGDDRFPNNLVNSGVAVEGRVLEEETCVLVANSVSARDQGQPSPTARTGSGARATGRTSPAPPRRATPPPARRATPTAARRATPTPQATAPTAGTTAGTTDPTTETTAPATSP